MTLPLTVIELLPTGTYCYRTPAMYVLHVSAQPAMLHASRPRHWRLGASPLLALPFVVPENARASHPCGGRRDAVGDAPTIAEQPTVPTTFICLASCHIQSAGPLSDAKPISLASSVDMYSFTRLVIQIWSLREISEDFLPLWAIPTNALQADKQLGPQQRPPGTEHSGCKYCDHLYKRTSCKELRTLQRLCAYISYLETLKESPGDVCNSR
jgi:hypothetical protein